MGKRRMYSEVVKGSEPPRNEPAVVEAPRPAPWSAEGRVVGIRHFGPMCAPNPMKSATVKLVEPDEPAVVVTGAPPASSCVML
jgi:hypothetical protein